MDAPQAPGEAPHRVAASAGKKGLQGLKNLPPWALMAAAGAVLILFLYLRHSKSTSTSSQDASAASTDSTGDSSYGSDGYGYPGDTSGIGGSGLGSQSGYDLGYSQGLSAADSFGQGLGTMNSTGAPNGNSPVSSDGGNGGINITEPTINLSIPTGGGAPATGGSGVHSTPAKPPAKPPPKPPAKPAPKPAPKITTAKSPLGAALSNLKPAKPPAKKR